MNGERFDTLLREVANPTSRRRIVGGVLGGVAALVAGTAVIKAKPGNGKAKGKTKVTICHYQGTNEDGTPKYKALKLGAPGAENHARKHEEDGFFGNCCPGDTCTPQGQCYTAECTGTEDTITGTTTFSCASQPKPFGDTCTINGLEGQCDGSGLCCDDFGLCAP